MTSVLSNLSFKLTGILSTSSTSVTVSNDIELNQVIAAQNASVVLQNSTWTELERMICTFAAGTMTIVYRWLDQSAVVTEVPALKKEWRTGTTWYITLLAPDIIDANSTAAQILAWTYTFTWNNTFSWDNTHSWDEVFSWTLKEPIYTSAAARDLAITSPANGMVVYCTAEGKYYDYTAWSWIPRESWWTFPNASETVAGKVEIATTTQFNTWTDTWETWAVLVAKPSDIVNKISTDIIAIDQSVTISSFIAWENLTENDAVFLESWTTLAAATSEWSIGYNASTTRFGLPIFGNWVWFDSLKLNLRRFSSPSVDLNLRIETDNTGSPSWTLFWTNAVASIPSSSLSTSLTNYLLSGTEVTDSTWLTLNSAMWSQTSTYWYRFLAKKRIIIKSITKDANTSSAKWAKIKSDTWNTTLATSADFSWNTATFTTPYEIAAWTYFRIEVYAAWNFYPYQYSWASAHSKTNVDYVVGSVDWVDTSSNFVITDVVTEEVKDIILAWTPTNNDNLVTLNSTETNQTAYKWVKVTLLNQVSILTVVKDSDCTATHCYLYDTTGNALTSWAFSSQTATLNYNALTKWNSYYIMVGSWWSAYTSVKQTWASAYPYTKTDIDYISWIDNKWTTLAENSWITNSNIYSAYTDVYSWYKITPLKDIVISTVTKDASCSQLYCRITDLIGNVLAQATFVWNVATFSTQYKLTAWTSYNVTAWSWDWYSHNTTTAATYPTGETFPTTRTNIRYDSWAWYFTSIWRNINTIDSYEWFPTNTNINNITDITTSTNVNIPEWQKCHIVLYAWTYWSETTNTTNYYGIGYGTNNTTTRWIKLWWWSSWWAIANTVFPYVSSAWIQDQLLSKTDSDFSYKIDFLWFANETKTTWQTTKVATNWIKDWFTWLTPTSTYFLGATPWGLGTSAGSNTRKIWKWITPDKLKIIDLPL